MTAFTLSRRKDIHVLAGFLNETADLAKIAAAPGETLKLDLQGLIGLSSLGTGAFIRFISGLKDAPIELHECPRFLVEMVNVMPHMVGGKAYGHRVHSCYLPCRCKQCETSVDALIKTKDVRYVDTAIELPVLRCHQCRQPLEPTVDLLEYFLFLYG
jgi:hypothetical protein